MSDLVDVYIHFHILKTIKKYLDHRVFYHQVKKYSANKINKNAVLKMLKQQKN